MTVEPATRHIYSGKLQRWLDTHALKFNQSSFIAGDPISVPRRFERLQDIEIAGLFAAIMAWGQRPTIIRKAEELMALMDHAPHAFITGHKARDLNRFLAFRHRTLQPDDVLFLIHALRSYYRQHESLEDAFLSGIRPDDADIEGGINAFYHMLFDRPDVMERTRKHIPAPERKSACKRINMYLRWMVRRDENGVDFGLWKRIHPDKLIIPLDLHVARIARGLGLLHRAQNDWQAALQLTAALRMYDPSDPVKYDFALFGAGVAGDQSVSDVFSP